MRFEPSRIDQLDHGTELIPLRQIALDHRAPLFTNRPGGFGIAVAWQIHEKDRGHHLVAGEYAKEIERLRLSRGRTDLGDGLAIQQRINRRRFAHIGAPHEGYLGKALTWIVRRLHATLYKIR